MEWGENDVRNIKKVCFLKYANRWHPDIGLKAMAYAVQQTVGYGQLNMLFRDTGIRQLQLAPLVLFLLYSQRGLSGLVSLSSCIPFFKKFRRMTE